jgi:hypothetical protein
MTLDVQARGDPLLAAWPILYSRFTDLDSSCLRDVPKSCLVAAADAVGGHHTQTDRHSLFLAGASRLHRVRPHGRVRVNMRTQGEIQ